MKCTLIIFPILIPSVERLEGVFLTEVSIAGSNSRTTSSSQLKDCWIQASKETGSSILEYHVEEYIDFLKNHSVHSAQEINRKPLLFSNSSLVASMRAAHQILKTRTGDQPGIIVVTGSLHLVSSVLDYLQN